AHHPPATSAIATTTGVSTADARSAMRSMRVRDASAASTNPAMRAVALADTGAVTRTRKVPSTLVEPPATTSPGRRSTGSGSPLSAASSFDDDAVRRETVARRDGDEIAGRERVGRHGRDTGVVDAPGARWRGAERPPHERAGVRAGARLEVASERHQ